jgi:hypothetical protein
LKRVIANSSQINHHSTKSFTDNTQSVLDNEDNDKFMHPAHVLARALEIEFNRLMNSNGNFNEKELKLVLDSIADIDYDGDFVTLTLSLRLLLTVIRLYCHLPPHQSSSTSSTSTAGFTKGLRLGLFALTSKSSFSHFGENGIEKILNEMEKQIVVKRKK